MTDFSRRLDQLSPPKRALLAQHLAAARTAGDGDGAGERRLIAYVVRNGARMPDESQLKRYLNDHLPDYMIPSSVVLLDALPRTPNGKVDVRALPDPDMFEPLTGAFVAPRSPLETSLTSIWEAVLGVSPIGIHDNFFEIGGDSILSIQIIARMRRAGLQVSPTQLFEHQTIARLATAVRVAETAPLVRSPRTGDVSLTPIQHWFFEHELAEAHHWNQSLWIALPETVTVDRLQQAMEHLVAHHDAFRLRFESTNGRWRQRLAPLDAVRVRNFEFDLSGLEERARLASLRAIAAEQNTSIRLDAPPLMRSALVRMGAGKPQRLLLSIHHLVVDPLSWQIILDDLWAAYRQLEQGDPVELPEQTTSFEAWSEALQSHADSAAVRGEKEYWLKDHAGATPRIPVDLSDGSFTEATAETVMAELGAEETRALLHDVHTAYNTRIEDLLLTALMRSFASWTGSESLLVGLERHGREELQEGLDLSRTVGWFTAFFPVRLHVDRGADAGTSLKAIKEQLRRIPGGGLGYGVLRYLYPDSSVRDRLRSLPQPEIILNYTGRADRPPSDASPFQPMQLISSSRGEANHRGHLLEVNSFIVNERLVMHWTFSTSVHRPDTIARLSSEYLTQLRGLIAHCRSSEAGGYTPSDFPEAGLSGEELEKLLENLR